jgi:processing peptidase subunit alpha
MYFNRLEKYGGICDCQSTRDTFLYAASVDSRGLEATVEILGDVVLRPKITDDELEYTRSAVQFELEDASLKPDQEPIMVEALHAAAFAGNTLGLPKLCPGENLVSINRQVLLKYLSTYHAPERMVLAGVGVDHDALVEAAQKHFVETKPSWRSETSSTAVLPDKSLAQYTGGIVTIKKASDGRA